MGGISIVPQEKIEEVLLVGQVGDTHVVIVGSKGGPEAWEAARNLVAELGRGGNPHPIAVVVDVVHAQIRYALDLREMGHSDLPELEDLDNLPTPDDAA